jgi:hypothetical protein
MASGGGTCNLPSLCALDVANCMPDLHDPTASSSPTAPEHLNSTGCRIKYSEGKGRGVYGSLFVTPRYVELISLSHSVHSPARIYVARD